MKHIQALLALVALSAILTSSATAHAFQDSKKDYGVCFTLIEQKVFEEAEKEVGSTAAFGVGSKSTLPRIFRGSFRHPEDGTIDESVIFPPVEKIPEFWPGMLLRTVLVYDDGERETFYFESKGRIDSLKSSSGKKVITPNVRFQKIARDDRKIKLIEVTALTMPRNGKRIKYTADIPEDSGG